MENTDATQKICFTLAPHTDGNGVNVTQIQIDDEAAIPIDIAGPLTAESAQIIAKEFTYRMSPPPLYEKAASNPETLTGSVNSVNSVTELTPPPPPTNNIMNAQLTGKYQQYTLGSLLNELKLPKGDENRTMTTRRYNLATAINNKLADWNKIKDLTALDERQNNVITSDIIALVENKNNDMMVGVDRRTGRIVLGGAHKTVKNLHTRRRVKSNTRKGHVYRQNTSRRAAPRHRVTRRR